MRTETFTTPGAVTLQINVPAGDVDIETRESAETVVELEVRGRDSEELERETRIEARPRVDGHEVVVDAAQVRRLLRIRGGDYRVRIQAPPGAAVRAELATADIRGRGRYGELELDVASGDVEFDQVDGEAKVNTASGDVELRRVASARLNSASGDIRVVEAAGSLEVNTASGDVQIRKVVEGNVKAHSASGDIEVGIAKGSRLWVDAQSLSGDTSSELELEPAPVPDDEGPLVELRAQTMSGDISVRRA
ncbi:MAG TPA: DUF4097 family beta strand repeat-containing protein [Gaiellaceae bacterium]|nr:DUF4097 family beta strand repeat-containing protein [Gaiellaceae bacterium]